MKRFEVYQSHSVVTGEHTRAFSRIKNERAVAVFEAKEMSVAVKREVGTGAEVLGEVEGVVNNDDRSAVPLHFESAFHNLHAMGARSLLEGFSFEIVIAPDAIHGCIHFAKEIQNFGLGDVPCVNHAIHLGLFL